MRPQGMHEIVFGLAQPVYAGVRQLGLPISHHREKPALESQKQITVHSEHAEGAPVIYLPVVMGNGSEVYGAAESSTARLLLLSPLAGSIGIAS